MNSLIPKMAVNLHDVPQQRTVSYLHHGLGSSVRFLAQSSTQPTRQNNGLHVVSPNCTCRVAGAVTLVTLSRSIHGLHEKAVHTLISADSKLRLCSTMASGSERKIKYIRNKYSPLIPSRKDCKPIPNKTRIWMLANPWGS